MDKPDGVFIFIAILNVQKGAVDIINDIAVHQRMVSAVDGDPFIGPFGHHIASEHALWTIAGIMKVQTVFAQQDATALFNADIFNLHQPGTPRLPSGDPFLSRRIK